MDKFELESDSPAIGKGAEDGQRFSTLYKRKSGGVEG
jgi:hypothetical protein